MDVTGLDLFVHWKPPLHRGLAVRKKQKLLDERPKLGVGPTDKAAKKDIQSLLEGLEGLEFFISDHFGERTVRW